MTGQELYELYRDVSLQECNCESDTWGMLDNEQAIWEALAARLQERS